MGNTSSNNSSGTTNQSQQQRRSSGYPGHRGTQNQRASHSNYPGAGRNNVTSSLPVVRNAQNAAQISSSLPARPGGSSVVIRGTPVSAKTDPERPGAYAVTRTSSGPAQVFRVTVPAGVRPGSEFSVHAGSRRVRVKCPPTTRPGQSLQITLPPEAITNQTLLQIATLTAPDDESVGGGYAQMSKEVAQVNRTAVDSGGTAQTFLVTIPPNVYPGMQFTVTLEGQRFMVTCPPNASPNMKVRIVPPTKPEEPEAAPKTQVFEVVVPPNAKPGQPFTLMANGQRVLVTCPMNVVPGQKIRFQLPVQHMVGNIKLSYEGNHGWNRTIRVQDLKFQWVRTENDQVVFDESEIDFNASAFVRKFTYLEGNDARMRTAKIDFVPAHEAAVDSKLMHGDKTLISYADISDMQEKTLDEKTKWFEKLCEQLTGEWDNGHIKILVRRSSLLQDSVDAVMSLSREDLRKRWRFEFSGEPGIDAGGVTREWFQLVSEELFDPDRGLWLSSSQNQMCMVINPASGCACPDDHLIYFRFLGRMIGRALFNQQVIKGHMVRHIYKHLLGWPISFNDIDYEDHDYYSSLKKLANMDDVSLMCLDFTTTEETLGTRTEVELVDGGAMREVTNENVSEYLEANLRYRMFDRTKNQMSELLLGFFDVIPEPALTIFDPNELELMLCGLPEIDIKDWEQNTLYSGLFESKTKVHRVVTWFWDIINNEFDQEMRARLLQFVTGTSGVPARGFSVLQSNDGNIKKFTIHGVDRSQFLYPRGHTCFNRIDLPTYNSKKEMFEKLKLAITTSAIGFGIE